MNIYINYYENVQIPEEIADEKGGWPDTIINRSIADANKSAPCPLYSLSR